MDTLNYIRIQIESTLKTKGIPKKDFFKKLNIANNTYNQAFYRKSLRLDTYLKICEILSIDPASLFPGQEPSEKKHIEHSNKYVKILEDQVTLLNEKISNYEKKK